MSPPPLIGVHLLYDHELEQNEALVNDVMFCAQQQQQQQQQQTTTRYVACDLPSYAIG